MAWTTPRTWTVGEVLTAANLNTHLRDNLLAVRGDRNTTAQTVSNTTTETAILSHTVPAGSMGASDGILKATVVGSVVNVTAGAVNLTVRIKFGGTTLWEDTLSIPATIADRPFEIAFLIANMGGFNTNFMNGRLLLGDTTDPTTGLGEARTQQDSFGFAVALASPAAAMTVDTSAAQDLEVSVQWASADSALQAKRRFWLLRNL